MYRKVVVSALVIVSLQVAGVAFMRATLADSVLTNSLQTISSVLAALMCFRASRRAHGLSKPFWQLIGCAILAWGVANSYWMYYEVILRVEPSTGSVARFL